MRKPIALAASLALALAFTSPARADEGRQGTVYIKREGRKIDGKITKKNGKVIVELGHGASAEFDADEVTITYDAAPEAGPDSGKRRVVEVEKKDGGVIRGEVVEEKADSITIKPRGQAPMTFRLSETSRVTTIEDAGPADSDVGDRFIDFEARFQIERPSPEWKIRNSTSPETRALLSLTGKDAFIAIGVKPAAPATAACYQEPTKESARKVQGEVETELRGDLEKFSGLQLDVGELFGTPVVEARFDGKYPSETTEYQFIEQRFVRDGLLYTIRGGAEKKTTFKEVEAKLRDAFTCFSFIAPQGGDDTGYNDLVKGYGLERPTEKWTIDARPFDEKEPVFVRNEDGKATLRVRIYDASGRDATAAADDYLKATAKKADCQVSEKKDGHRGSTPVVTYHVSYFEANSATKNDEQGLVAVVEGRVIHVVGLAPFAGPESKDLQREVAKAIDSFKVFDPKRKRLGEGAQAVEEFTKGVEAYKKRQFSEAVSFLSEAIKLYPDYARAFFWRATCQIELKAWKDYRDDLGRALDLDPRPELQTRAAALYLAEANSRVKDKQWTDACKAWREAIRNDPKNEKYRRDFLRFYQDWWNDLKRTNTGVKAKDGLDDIESYKWSDRDFEPVFAQMCVEAGSMILSADKRQYGKARSLASKALGYDRGCKQANDLIRQCDEARKQLEKSGKK